MELCARQVLGDGTALSEWLLHPQVGGRYGDHIKTRDRRGALLGMSLGGSCEERTSVLAQGAHSVPVCPAAQRRSAMRGRLPRHGAQVVTC